MNDVVIARAIHVLFVVIWIGGVAMVTTIVLPIVRGSASQSDGLGLLKAVERRFVWQARIATLLVAASGFYMAARLDLWDRFGSVSFWWMHAMVLVWLIFTFILFIGEPLAARWPQRHARTLSPAMLARMHWLHWALLALSVVTVLAAVAGSQGLSLVP